MFAGHMVARGVLDYSTRNDVRWSGRFHPLDRYQTDVTNLELLIASVKSNGCDFISQLVNRGVTCAWLWMLQWRSNYKNQGGSGPASWDHGPFIARDVASPEPFIWAKRTTPISHDQFFYKSMFSLPKKFNSWLNVKLSIFGGRSRVLCDSLAF